MCAIENCANEVISLIGTSQDGLSEDAARTIHERCEVQGCTKYVYVELVENNPRQVAIRSTDATCVERRNPPIEIHLV